METINQFNLGDRLNVSSNFRTSHSNAFAVWFNRQAMSFEKSRYGWMAMLITFQSCLGSIACMYILKNQADIFMMSTCAVITMGCNALFIALAPPKVCLFAFYLSVVLNAIFLLINL